MSDIKDGRFEGDIYAELTHDPIEKRPFRVRVWVWGWVLYWDAEKQREKLGWRGARGNYMWREPNQESNFKTLDKAVDHLYLVRASAEKIALHKKVSGKAESRRELLA